MQEIRDEKADYVFCNEKGYPNVASYMASYNLTGKEYQQRRAIWLQENNYKLLKYVGTHERGNLLYEKICDVKEYLQVFRQDVNCGVKESILRKLLKNGYFKYHESTEKEQKGFKWATKLSIQTITEKIL